MSDPFESLRHDADRTGSTAVDPRFRADLLAEARTRLAWGTSTDSVRPRVTTDTPTPIPMEPTPMLAKNPKQTRPLLLAAACVALVAAGVVTVAALRGGDGAPAEPAPTNAAPNPTATETQPATTPPPTATPTPPTTNASAPTTVAPATPDPTADAAIARSMLLTPADVGPGWEQFRDGTDYALYRFDPEAGSPPQCGDFTDSVFEPMHAGVTDNRILLPPIAAADWTRQHVTVLADREAAVDAFLAMKDPAFQDCAINVGRMFDGLRFTTAGEPFSEVPIAQVAIYRYTKAIDADVDRDLVGALIQAGRTITYLDAMLIDPAGNRMLTEDQFQGLIETIAAAAEQTLADPSAPPVPTLPPLSADEIAKAVLLKADEYAPGWTIVPAQAASIGASWSFRGVHDLPDCAPYWDSVFLAVQASEHRVFFHADPAAAFTQLVAVFPDENTASRVYETVNSAEFVPCALAIGTAIAPAAAGLAESFPSPVDQPISAPPFDPVGDAMTYRTFVEGGQQTDLDAVVLVGRTITFIGTPTQVGETVLNTEDQFEAALHRIVERTNAALAGEHLV